MIDILEILEPAAWMTVGVAVYTDRWLMFFIAVISASLIRIIIHYNHKFGKQNK